MTENRPLKAFAAIICIIAVIIVALSGLCSIFISVGDIRNAPAAFLIGAFGFVPAGLLAYAMFLHFKRGPNRTSETMALIIGLVLVAAALLLMSGLAGTNLMVNLIFSIPGLLVVAWALWSMKTRKGSEV